MPGSPTGRAGWGIVRGVLVVVALEIIVLSVPALVLGEERETSVHAARHLGAFAVAYGAALLVVVVRPARARTVLPVAATLAFALAVTAVVDVVEGQIPLTGEALHIPEVISVVLVWLQATPRLGHWLGREAQRAPSGPPMRLVRERPGDTGSAGARFSGPLGPGRHRRPSAGPLPACRVGRGRCGAVR